MHWRSAKDLIMGQRHHSKPERILLMKIDWFILSYCCLMYFTNYLDRSNINNAYVSGMKEDLNMLGNQFNKINTIFTCGYIIGMIPNNLMLQLVSPRIWFPCMQLTWAVLTFCTSVVKNVEQIYVIRFFQAIAESSTFVGAHYILGSWYKPRELGKRTGIFTSSGLVGTLFSGILQGVVYRNLNGVGGRSGWRWLFIIDGIITLPIAFYGFLVFPDLPQTTRAFYLSEEERILAYERLDEKPEHAHGKHAFSWAAVRRVFTSWRWYACTLLFGISGETECIGSNNIMGQWMKAIGGFTVEQIDFYPSGLTSVAIASTLICATLTDRTQVRWPVLVYMAIACTISAICLLVWKAPTGLKFFAFYLSGASYAGQATTFAWANQICSNDDFERSIVLASMNVCNGAINAWWSLVLYPATDAPRFRKGMIAMICVCAATLGITWVVYALERREWRRGSDLKRNPGDRKSEEEGSRTEKAEGDHLEKEREEAKGQ